MSSGTVRKVSTQDLQLVQNLIERCLQLYMSQREVVETLLVHAKIEPSFTELVWQRLKEQNREFFKAYHLRLMVKHQIMEFNRLLEQQARLMHQMHTNGVASVPTSSGSTAPVAQQPVCHAAEQTGPAIKTEYMPQAIGTSLPNTFARGGSALQTNIHAQMIMPAHAESVGNSDNNFPAQNSNTGLMQGINGGMGKMEASYSGSPYMFGADNSALEARPAIGDTPMASVSSVESSSRAFAEPFLVPDNPPFGFLGQIPRNFSLSDLTADFSQSSDILESYPRSPFLAADNDNFVDASERVDHQGDIKRLDVISEGLSYEEFGYA